MATSECPFLDGFFVIHKLEALRLDAVAGSGIREPWRAGGCVDGFVAAGRIDVSVLRYARGMPIMRREPQPSVGGGIKG